MLYYNGRIVRKDKNKNCYLCNCDLIIKSGYKYVQIVKCTNSKCKSNIEKFFKWKRKAFYDKEILEQILEKNKKHLKDVRPNGLTFWKNKGFTEIEAKEKISEIQSNSSNARPNKNIFDTESLLLRGYSEKDAQKIIESRLKNNFSPVQKEFWIKKGFTEIEAKEKISKIQRENSSKVNYSNRLLPAQIEYWIKHGFSKKLAEQKRKEFCKKSYSITRDKINDYDLMMVRRRKTWFSKSEEERKKINKSRGRTVKQLIKQFGKEKTQIILNKRKPFKNKSWSNISKEMFQEFSKKQKLKTVYFAENEKFLFLNGKMIYPDFFDGKNFIIEFFGDIFHANPKIFEKYESPNPFSDKTSEQIWKNDKERINLLRKYGYFVHVVWEQDYKNNKKNTIKELQTIYEKNKKINTSTNIF